MCVKFINGSSKKYYLTFPTVFLCLLVLPDYSIADTNDEEMDRIEVTGSRIKRIALERSTPIFIYNAEDIQQTGLATLADFFREQLALGGLNESQTLSQFAGASAIGLKGFSSSYTLILLNGQRLPKNSAGGIFTDINQLPLAAIERIEVLSDGASAVYGSDAVAGVVNVITKRNFDGIDLTGKYGAAIKHYDAEELGFSMVAGISSANTDVMLALEYFERKPIDATDRELGHSAFIKGHEGGEARSTWGIPGSTLIAGEPNTQAFGEGWAPWQDCPAENIHSNGRCRYDFAHLYQLQPNSDRQSFISIITHEFSEDLVFDNQFRYARAYTKTSNAPAPGAVNVSSSPFLESFLKTDRYKNDHQKADDILNEIRANKAVAYVGRRYLDFPNRQRDNTNETFESIARLNYNLTDDWLVDFDFGFSRLVNRQVGAGGQLVKSQLEQAFADGTLNPFIVNDCSSAALKEICEDLQSAIHRTGEYNIKSSSIEFSGELAQWRLYGGYIALATGIDWRNEDYLDRADLASKNGEIIGSAGSSGGGERDNYAGFVEVSFPVADNAVINLAARHDNADWHLNDANETTYSLNASYAPIADLKLRASYNTGFIAPALDALYLNTSFGVNTAIDTKLCNAAGGNQNHPDCKLLELNVKAGGNTQLTPETSNSYNLGFAYQVSDSLFFSVDFWSLEVDNIIGSLNIQEILDEEAEGRLTHLVIRDNAGRLDSANNNGYVETILQNLSKQSASGLIYDVHYTNQFSFGRINASLGVEQYLSYKTQSSAIQPLCDDISDNAARKFNLNAGVAYQLNAFKTSIQLRYLPSYQLYNKRNTANRSCQLIGYYDVGQAKDAEGNLLQPGRAQHVASYLQFDLVSSYDINDKNKLTFGIRNLLDRQPPFSQVNSWPFYNQNIFSNTGRFMYLSYDFSF